ncbi:hypothetical protein D918_06326 [Trichuris suis]|nr:hypothetical protein D918_06326 [Trichuris suis]
MINEGEDKRLAGHCEISTSTFTSSTQLCKGFEMSESIRPIDRKKLTAVDRGRVETALPMNQLYRRCDIWRLDVLFISGIRIRLASRPHNKSSELRILQQAQHPPYTSKSWNKRQLTRLLSGNRVLSYVSWRIGVR